MTDDLLTKAREYELQEEQRIKDEVRPALHFTPRVGWLNDPNGFSFYKGEYHLFYQYHPYDTNWGPMHWGHATSKDLIHWTYLPAAMAPDKEFDNKGCFSGTALTYKDGRQFIMYTGVYKSDPDHECQMQCIAFGDGLNYTKYTNNPVINPSMLPQGGSTSDFRDPHVTPCGDGFKAVLVNRAADGFGSALIYKSEDGLNWAFDHELIHNKDGKYGTMWECPCYLDLDGKKVLIVSAMEMKEKGYEFHKGGAVISLIGKEDENGSLIPENVSLVDYGIDFYAPQAIKLSDGRTVMIGWMQSWDDASYRNGLSWFGQMTLPRELFVKGNRLYQRPLTELSQLHTDKVSYENISVNEDNIVLSGISGRVIDLEININSSDNAGSYTYFKTVFAGKDSKGVTLSYDSKGGLLTLDRSDVAKGDAVHSRTCALSPSKDLSLRLILDTFSVEVFANDGEKVMSLTYYNAPCMDEISFSSDGAKISLTKYSFIER